MSVLINMFENLPFPYFQINRDLQILQTSFKPLANNNSKTITDFLFQDVQSFHQFLNSDLTEQKVKLKTNENEHILYHMYKVKEDDIFHLFCYPIKNSEESTKNDVDHYLSYHKDLLSKDYSDTVHKLTAGIAHEIRNPLTTVKGFIQLIRPHLVHIEKEKYADIAIDEIDRANDIIFDFLNATKPHEDKWKTVSINQLISDIITLYESESTMKNTRIKTILSDENPHSYINHQQFKQVLVNMIKNAFEAIDEKKAIQNGFIKLTTTTSTNEVILTIEDNGCGMSQQTLDHLFNPFFTTKGEGTGVGLNVCKEIIEEFGGSLSVTSEKGIGTIFIIKLPLA